MHKQPIYTLLTIAGALPFLACAVLPLVGIDTVSPFGRLDRLAGIYGLAIISFLTGVHWATDLYTQNRTTLNLFVASNVLLLIVGAAFITTALGAALAVQVAALGVLLWIDYRLLAAGTLTTDYFRIRSVATALAAASLLAIVFMA